jgi:hypothetical protein
MAFIGRFIVLGRYYSVQRIFWSNGERLSTQKTSTPSGKFSLTGGVAILAKICVEAIAFK